MKNTSIIVVIVIVLIVLNCALMALLWLSYFGKKRSMQPVQGQPNEYLIRQLKLTPVQIKRYDTLRKQHHGFTQRISAEQRMQRDSFFDNLKNPKADMTAVMQLEKRILSNQGKLDSATFFHFRNFRAILTPVQQLTFDSVANNVMHMMGQPHPGEPQTNSNGYPTGRPEGQQIQGPPQRNGRYHLPGGRQPGPDGRPVYGPPPGGGPPPGDMPPPPWGN